MKKAMIHHKNRISRHTSLMPLEGLTMELWQRPFAWGLFRGFHEPSLDLTETENRIVVKAEVPGMEEKDLKLSIKGNMLSISGEKAAKREIKKKGSYFLERTSGSIQRMIRLPRDVNRYKRTTHCKNGLLTIEFDKK